MTAVPPIPSPLTAAPDETDPAMQPSVWRSLAATARDRRRHRRIEAALGARFLCAGGAEGIGKTLNISAGGAAIESGTPPPVGLPLILYLETIGRLEATVVRHLGAPPGFAVRFVASPSKRDRLIERLTAVAFSLATGQEPAPYPEGLQDLRRNARQIANEAASLTLPGGRTVECLVLDVSLGGLSLETAERPPAGSIVMVGSVRARVVRHHEKGVGVQILDDHKWLDASA